jgi:hypothetical protein
MKYLIVKQLSIDNHFLWDIWFQGLLSVYQKNKNNSHRVLAKSLRIKHFASHHFPKYFHIIKKKAIFKYWTSLNPHLGIFCYRFMMVVRKNVLEYIIALVVVKNKVRFKKCLNKIQIWQSSIVQINLYITSLRLIPKFRPVFDVNKFLNCIVLICQAKDWELSRPKSAPPQMSIKFSPKCINNNVIFRSKYI